MKQEKSKIKRRSKKVGQTELMKKYMAFFVPSPTAVNGTTGGSLEQPSPYRIVPSIVTYGVGQRPIVSFPNA